MSRMRAVARGGAVLFALMLSIDLAHAQSAVTVDEQRRTDERAKFRAEERAREAKRLEQEKLNRAELRARLDNFATTLPGLPFVKANTIVVTRNRVVFMFMQPDVTVALANRDRFGHYVWRWDVNEGVTAFSLVFAADTAMRTSDFGDIVRAGRVRRCRSVFETSALACTQPIDAFVARQGSGFRIEVSDTSVLNAVRIGQPHTATAITFAPLGRSVTTTSKFLYVNQNVKSDRE